MTSQAVMMIMNDARDIILQLLLYGKVDRMVCDSVGKALDTTKSSLRILLEEEKVGPDQAALVMAQHLRDIEAIASSLSPLTPNHDLNPFCTQRNNNSSDRPKVSNDHHDDSSPQANLRKDRALLPPSLLPPIGMEEWYPGERRKSISSTSAASTSTEKQNGVAEEHHSSSLSSLSRLVEGRNGGQEESQQQQKGSSSDPATLNPLRAAARLQALGQSAGLGLPSPITAPIPVPPNLDTAPVIDLTIRSGSTSPEVAAAASAAHTAAGGGKANSISSSSYASIIPHITIPTEEAAMASTLTAGQRLFIARYCAYLCITLLDGTGEMEKNENPMASQLQAAISQCVKQAVQIIELFGGPDGISLTTLQSIFNSQNFLSPELSELQDTADTLCMFLEKRGEGVGVTDLGVGRGLPSAAAPPAVPSTTASTTSVSSLPSSTSPSHSSSTSTATPRPSPTRGNNNISNGPPSSSVRVPPKEKDTTAWARNHLPTQPTAPMALQRESPIPVEQRPQNDAWARATIIQQQQVQQGEAQGGGRDQQLQLQDQRGGGGGGKCFSSTTTVGKSVSSSRTSKATSTGRRGEGGGHHEHSHRQTASAAAPAPPVCTAADDTWFMAAQGFLTWLITNPCPEKMTAYNQIKLIWEMLKETLGPKNFVAAVPDESTWRVYMIRMVPVMRGRLNGYPRGHKRWAAFCYLLEYISQASLLEVQQIPYFQELVMEALDLSNSIEGPSTYRLMDASLSKRTRIR